jgi:hypothetical protein
VQDAVHAVPMASIDEMFAHYNGCSPWGAMDCAYVYELHFSWRNIPVQVATTTSASCPNMNVSTLGLPQLGWRKVAKTLDWPRMHELTGLPVWRPFTP